MTECNTLDYQPVFIIGAARSGTKLLRDTLALHPQVDSIPYDINYIWRLGNEELPHDELSPELLTPAIRKRICRHFSSFHNGGQALIEKTVSNCLRVEYVQNVFPDAIFIHLVRDGIDVIESAYRQWLAPPDWGYILKKARSFPITEAFGYAYRYVGKVVHKLLFRDREKKDVWGPRYVGIDADILSKNLLEVCAIQWSRSVNKALEGLEHIPESQVFTVRYEEFVQEPHLHLRQISNFTSIDFEYFKQTDLEGISQDNIGKGKRNMTKTEKEIIRPHIQHTLEQINAL